MSSKEYGLIDKKSKKVSTSKPAIFNSDSDSDPKPKKTVALEPGESQKRQARVAREKALADDPTIYQYDELYDDMDTKRKEAKSEKSKADKKPKYINKLLETADKRKKEQERRIERQVQKEREAEGEMFKDKEAFVTSAYRDKLEEMKKADEEEKREEYLEAIGDVTKQGDLGGFYRHIYSQKVGETEKKVKKEETKLEEDDKKKKSKHTNDKSPKSRKYRKRKSDEEESSGDDKKSSKKKTHLQSNLDADSDFSIDSQSESEDDSSEEEKKVKEDKPKIKLEVKGEKNGTDKIEKSAETSKNNGKENSVSPATKKEEKKPEVKVKKPKTDIWKKRTTGDIFDAAVARYYERKAFRESG